MGISDKAKKHLKTLYGEHEYDYIMSDYNLASLLKEGYDTYEKFDKAARELDDMISYIKRKQEEMTA